MKVVVSEVRESQFWPTTIQKKKSYMMCQPQTENYEPLWDSCGTTRHFGDDGVLPIPALVYRQKCQKIVFFEVLKNLRYSGMISNNVLYCRCSG